MQTEHTWDAQKTSRPSSVSHMWILFVPYVQGVLYEQKKKIIFASANMQYLKNECFHILEKSPANIKSTADS